MKKRTVKPAVLMRFAQDILIDLFNMEIEYDTISDFCANKKVAIGRRKKQAHIFSRRLPTWNKSINHRIERMLYIGDDIERNHKFIDEQSKYKFEDEYQFLMTQIYAGLRKLRRMRIDEPKD